MELFTSQSVNQLKNRILEIGLAVVWVESQTRSLSLRRFAAPPSVRVSYPEQTYQKTYNQKAGNIWKGTANLTLFVFT